MSNCCILLDILKIMPTRKVFILLYIFQKIDYVFDKELKIESLASFSFIFLKDTIYVNAAL
ncbi:MAG: hypothetical protein ACI90V_004647 [Bacillariaceae sp.]|jgi:hypothetical protein